MRGAFPTRVIVAATGVLSPIIASVMFGAAGATPPPVIDPSSMAAARVGTVPAAAPGSVVLTGPAGRSETLTSADIAKRDPEQVSVDHDGKTLVYAGPALDDLLRDVGAPFGARIHGEAVNEVVLVTGSDRYRVVLTLPEVDPSFHHGSRVILADRVDGHPLDAYEGPYRLVVDGDLKPSRSVHSVVAIEIKRLP